LLPEYLVELLAGWAAWRGCVFDVATPLTTRLIYNHNLKAPPVVGLTPQAPASLRQLR
jgi:hypothetical protein